jgi:hypothetical protein
MYLQWTNKNLCYEEIYYYTPELLIHGTIFLQPTHPTVGQLYSSSGSYKESMDAEGSCQWTLISLLNQQTHELNHGIATNHNQSSPP